MTDKRIVSDNPNRSKESDAFLPERHVQKDLFLCDVTDVFLKDFHQEMEHPFFSLSKNPDHVHREYQLGDNWIKITPSGLGMATVYDKDVLIYAISQLVAAMNRGEEPKRCIRMSGREFLMFANRKTGGREYRALEESLDRLGGTRIRTNIVTGDEEEVDGFSLIGDYKIRRKRLKSGKEGSMLWIELELSKWVFNAVKSREVLTLHEDYFRLKKPLERRVYELARKHCGHQKSFKIGIEKLYLKSGSRSNKRQFRYLLTQIAKTDHIPDYHVHVEGDMVIFISRGTVTKRVEATDTITLPSYAHEDAREVAPGWDPRFLEQKWRNWVVENRVEVRSPGKHFRRFCETYYARNGRPR